ncbi:ATP-NAD kinase-like domain-containing protein [Chaetomidium leptoderma]|uniref:ATP-NAD kinase-like domain-containing protein n=1 Tax=Chaetomidium leptoderma TaxID=669021 RepID=A0AAN7A098_9PEZI|nr:ATP-NAD kinase-like domain-containing protein [Chaetomidium leptoderma]
MAIQDLPSNTGDNQSPPANIDLENVDAQHTSSYVIAKLKREEIVFVLRAPEEADGGFLIYSLSEGSTPDDGKPFSLDVVQCQQQQLPDELSEFLVDRDSLPPSHLRLPRPVHVVVSTGSGLRRAQEFYEGVLRPLLGAAGLAPRESEVGEGYQVMMTKNANTVRDFARELGRDKDAGEKTVILLSGDGGVVDLLNELDHTSSSSSDASPSPSPTIALLPLGTGNALFHSLHKPHYTSPSSSPTPSSPLVLGLRTLFKGTAAPLPTFRASFSPGAKLISAPVNDPAAEHITTTERKDHEKKEGSPPPPPVITHLLGAIVASYGFHASLVWESDTPAYRVHGDKRFGMAAAELLKMSHAYDARVEVRRGGGGDFVSLAPHRSQNGDDEQKSVDVRGGGRFNYVLTTLVSNLEKTFTISPASRPLDGQLRLVHFGDVSGDKTMEIMMGAYREGEHVQMKEVGYEEVDEVRVTIAEEDARWRKVCVDGSIVELERGGWMSVTKEGRERLRVLV